VLALFPLDFCFLRDRIRFAGPFPVIQFTQSFPGQFFSLRCPSFPSPSKAPPEARTFVFSAGSIAAEGVFPIVVPCAEWAARFDFGVPLIFLAVSPA
jgi:hypothetical protein